MAAPTEGFGSRSIADETLFLELALRGYDLSKLRLQLDRSAPVEIF